MGWASGGEIFDDVARALIDAGVGERVKHTVLGRLIDKLRDGDWDTEGESLEQFGDDPVIVALFRERGVTTTCRNDSGPAGTHECERKLGHAGDHVDEDDNSWPQAAEGAS